MSSLTSKISLEKIDANRWQRVWKLATVDFKKRYYNDVLGVLWALINPLFRISVYYFVIVKIFGADQIDNYAIFLFSGLIFWLVFAEATKTGMNVLNQKRYLIENIQFNKTDLFISHTLAVFMGFFFSLIVYIAINLIVGLSINWTILWLPILLIILFMLTMGVTMLLSTLQIFFTDLKHIWNLATLVGFWTSGIFFRSTRILEEFPPLYFVNPMVGLIENFRAVTMYGQAPKLDILLLDFGIALFFLILGIFCFKKFSHKFLELS